MPAHQTGAKQRCNRDVCACLTERKAISDVGDKVRGKAAVLGIAGEARPVAKVFAVAPAIRAFAAGVT